MRTLPPKNEHCRIVPCHTECMALLDAAQDNWYLVSNLLFRSVSHGRGTYLTRYLSVAARDNLYDILILLDAVLDAAQVTGFFFGHKKKPNQNKLIGLNVILQ